MTISAKSLTGKFAKRLNPTFKVELSFVLPPGITVLFGPSGSGKTSILRIIAGLDTPDHGSIALAGMQFYDSTTILNVPAHLRRVGVVFQDLALFPHLSALQNVEFGLHDLPLARRRERAMEFLSRFRVAEAAQRKPAQLSGGERQRVALARTLATQPSVLLLDEPLSALDSAIKASILDDIVRWVKDNPIPVVYVTHDRDELYSVADRVMVLSDGKITHLGAPADVLSASKSFRVSRTEEYENLMWATARSLDEPAGTMTCNIGGAEIEAPMPHGVIPPQFQIAISAGDILLATSRPEGISARNVLRGEVTQVAHLDHSIAVSVRCGCATLVSHVTPNAVSALHLEVGNSIWLLFKTHSCHVMRD
jgi:molybdate transport system ATP-binding protein